MINTKLTVGKLVGLVVCRCIVVGRCVGLRVLDVGRRVVVGLVVGRCIVVGRCVGLRVLMFLGHIQQELQKHYSD